ncbi:MAG: Na+/H+ antiporter subunit E [Alphaproteobacteria bacterium]|nr:Na+/H+ antiporter subunit E [Alphaproteobacteria bacterium]
MDHGRFAEATVAEEKLLHALGLFAVLFGTWILLSGHFTPFLLIAGAVCAAVTVAITLRMDLLDQQRDFLGPVWRLPLYWLWLAGQIMLWSLTVARKVLAPRLDIDPVLERVPSSQRSDIAKVIYANSITLTPGTLSTDVSGGEIEVHALTRAAMEDLKSGDMDRRVSATETKGAKPARRGKAPESGP